MPGSRGRAAGSRFASRGAHWGIVAILVLGVAPGTLRAEEDDDYARERSFVGVSGIFALEDTSGDFDRSNSGGVDVHLGHRLARWLAFELQGGWQRFSGADPFTITVGGRIYYPDLGVVQPYVSGGGGVLSLHHDGGSETQGVLRAGVGADVHVTDRVALSPRVEYVSGTGRLNDFNYVAFGLGVMVHFESEY
jgi:hypothetical protein